MADVSDPRIREAVEDVRSDVTDTDWLAVGYEGKNTLVLKGTGSGGHAELMKMLDDSKVFFCLLRLADGDQESKRIKFVSITFAGENVGGLARGRVGVHVGSIRPLLGQCNVDLSADNTRECSEAIIRKKLKVAGGADYDTGSNASGYKSEASSLRKKALQAYQAKEKEGNIKSVTYVTSALPSTTPVDLNGRKMVAPPTEARKNIQDNILDTSKFQGQASTSTGSGIQYDEDRTRKPSVSKPKVGRKPSINRKPSVSSKPDVATKPKPESKPEPKPEPKPVAKPEVDNADSEASSSRWSMSEGPVVEDAEERRRLREEARKARREASRAKSDSDGKAASSSPVTQRREETKPEPVKEPEPEPAKEPEPEPEQEPVKETEPEPAAAEEPEPVQVSENVAEEAPKKKTTSLFDDDEDDDDELFGGKPKATTKTNGSAKLFDDLDDESTVEDAKAPLVDQDEDITISSQVLAEFLKAQGLLKENTTYSAKELLAIISK